MKNKAAIYIRVSTAHQIDRDSLQVQRRELVAYSEYVLGIPDVEVFEDAGFSAKNTDRPAFQQMMERTRSGEFSHILVWKIDRISRNLMDFSTMYAELRKCGVTFISKNEQFDTGTAVGEAMLKIILVFAELERKMTSERVSAVMLSRANNGQWNGGKIPFGYEWDGSKFGFCKEEAETVQQIYDMYEDMHSTLGIAKRLNDLGVTTRRGTQWSATTVYKILTNPFYIGCYQYNVHDEKDSFKKRHESEWVTVDDHHAPIINRPQFERVQQTLSVNSKLARRFRTRKNVHLFSGLLECGYCGSNMSSTAGKVRADGSRPSVYACAKRRNGTCPNKYTSDLEIAPFVFAVLQIILTSKELPIRSIERRFRTKLGVSVTGLEEMMQQEESDVFAEPSGVGERDILEGRKRNIEKALRRLRNLYLHTGTMSEAEYEMERKKLSDELSDVEQRLSSSESVEREMTERVTYFALMDRMRTAQFDYGKFAPYADALPMQRFLRSTISRITVKDGFVSAICFKNKKILSFSSNQKTAISPPSGQS